MFYCGYWVEGSDQHNMWNISDENAHSFCCIEQIYDFVRGKNGSYTAIEQHLDEFDDWNYVNFIDVSSMC